MSDAEVKSERGKSADLHVIGGAQPNARSTHKARIRIVPILVTLATAALAAWLGWEIGRAHV